MTVDRKPAWLKPGTVFKDKGFVSTSLKPNIAKEFADEGEGDVVIRMNIRAPKGAKAAPVYVLPDNEFKYQKEIVLPRNSYFRVNRVKETVKYADEDLKVRQYDVDLSYVQTKAR